MNIELHGIHKRFGKVHANNNINMVFREGEIVGILGENGAGKSTLMKILSGYQPADEGSILIDGQRVNYHGPLAAIQHGIGMLQQDPLDIAAFSVLENFLYGSPTGWIPNRRAGAKKLAEMAARFNFDLNPQAPVAALSIAQRQQLEIVRLLSLNVKTLILDEPTTGISAEQKDMLFGALRHLAKQEGMIVLLVSHKLEDVISLCDRVAVLRAGQLVAERQMPATAAELVTLMFGEQLRPQTRAQVDLTRARDVLALREVSLRAERLEIERVSMRVRAGEVIGFAGLDGSGQELVMRAMCGLHPPLEGEVWVGDSPMTHKPYRQYAAQGVVFAAAGRTEEGLIAGLTLTEHMALVMDNAPVLDWDAARAQMQKQIGHYDIRGQANDMIESLSGGNQQRVLMALLPEKPTLMILENPTRGLDVDSGRWIWQQILRRRDYGTGIVFSSPDLDELVAYSDRIFVFYAGRVVEIADVQRTTVDELGHYIGGHFEGVEHAKGT